jgi:cell division protein FtsB
MSTSKDNNLNNLTPDPRFVFNDKNGPEPSDVVVRKNRPIPKNRPSLFRTILLIFCLIMLGVFAIKNIITVDLLADEINKSQNDYTILTNKIKLLRAEVDEKKSFNRITTIAQKELNMIESKDQIIWLDIDAETLNSMVNKTE